MAGNTARLPMVELVQQPAETLSDFARRASTNYNKHPEGYFAKLTWNVDRREILFTPARSGDETLHVSADGRTTELEISSLINIIAGGRFGQPAWLKDVSKRQRVIIVDGSSGTPQLQKGFQFGR